MGEVELGDVDFAAEMPEAAVPTLLGLIFGRQDVRCDEFGSHHEPHEWTDDEFPDQPLYCDGKALTLH